MTKITLIKGLNVNNKVILLFIVVFTAGVLPSCMKSPFGKSYKTKYITEFYTVRNTSMYHISKMIFTGANKSTGFEFDVTFENHESKYDSIRFTFSLFNEFPVKTLNKLLLEVDGAPINITEFEPYYLEPKPKGWECRFSSYINFNQFEQLYKTDATPIITIYYSKAGESNTFSFNKCKKWDKCVEAVNNNIFILTDLD